MVQVRQLKHLVRGQLTFLPGIYIMEDSRIYCIYVNVKTFLLYIYIYIYNIYKRKVFTFLLFFAVFFINVYKPKYIKRRLIVLQIVL